MRRSADELQAHRAQVMRGTLGVAREAQMAFVSKSFLVITIAMLVLVALNVTLLQHWFVLALVVVLAGIFTALARVILGNVRRGHGTSGSRTST